MKNRNTYPTLAVGLFAALLASAASAQTLVSGSVPLSTKVTTVTSVAGTLSNEVDYQGKMAWMWDAARGEYPGAYPLDVGAEIDNCPNALLDGVLDAHFVAMAAVEGEGTNLSYLFDKKKGVGQFVGDGVTPLSLEADKRYHHRIRLDSRSLKPGVHVFRYYGLVAGGKRDDHTAVVIFHWPKTSEISRPIDNFRFMAALWPKDRPAPTYIQFCSILEQAGCGGMPGNVFDQIASIIDQVPAVQPVPQAEQPCGANGTDQAINAGLTSVANLQEVIDSLAANDDDAAAAIAKLSDQLRGVNAELQQLRSTAVSANDLAPLFERVDKLTKQVAQLTSITQSVVDWHQKVSTPQPTAPTPVEQPMVVSYRVVFVRSPRTSTWQVDSIDQVCEPIICDAVYIKYTDDSGRVRTDQYVAPAQRGQIVWRDERIDSNREIGVSLKRVGNGSVWQSRSWVVTAKTHVVVVPVNN